jgi:hypothetical protein
MGEIRDPVGSGRAACESQLGSIEWGGFRRNTCRLNRGVRNFGIIRWTIFDGSEHARAGRSYSTIEI